MAACQQLLPAGKKRRIASPRPLGPIMAVTGHLIHQDITVDMKRSLYLLWQFSRRDVASRYRGTGLGQLWSILAPLLLLVIYTFVFSVVFEARWGERQNSKTDYAMYLFTGMILHSFLAECLNRGSNTLLQHSNYVKRVVFPLWILPLVPVVSGLFHAGVSALVLLAAILWLGNSLHWTLLLLPMALLPLVLVGIGASWLLAALGVFIRDLGQIMPMLTTVLLFTAPIFYPVSALPEAYQGWMYLNPLTAPTELCRVLLFDGELPSWDSFLAGYPSALFTFVGGALVFKRLKRGFADAL